MAKSPDPDDSRVLECWRRNAAPWVRVVRSGGIDSRRRVTDRAIIDVVVGHSPRTLLDIGCGEGWFARAMAARGVRVIGTDAVESLVEAARARGGGDFRVRAHEAVAAEGVGARVDAVVCNFSLIGQHSAERLMAAAPRLLHAGGVFVVQTLHPFAASGEAGYRDGWREGSWAGFGDGFAEAPPWYFRTLESWLTLLADSDLRLLQLREPRLPGAALPASLILVATVA